MTKKMTRVSRTTKSAQRDDIEIQEEDPGFQVESSDVTIGVIIAVVLPGLVYMFLALAGMPVAKQEGLTYEESQALRKEQFVRPEPPLTAQEFEERFQRTGDLVDRYVTQYRGAAQVETDPTVHQAFLDAAMTCLNRAQTELKELEQLVSKSAEIRPRVTEVQNRLNHVSRLQREVKDESKFRAVYESQEARKAAEQPAPSK